MFFLMIQEPSHLFYKWLYEVTWDIRIFARVTDIVFPDTFVFFCSDAIKIDQQDFNTMLLSLRPMAPLSLCTLGKIRVYQKYLKLYSVFVSIGFHLELG